MCAFEGNRAVVVCDVAIARVRQEAESAFGSRLRCTVIDGQGTRIEVASSVDPADFALRIRAAIAAAQAGDD